MLNTDTILDFVSSKKNFLKFGRFIGYEAEAILVITIFGHIVRVPICDMVHANDCQMFLCKLFQKSFPIEREE